MDACPIEESLNLHCQAAEVIKSLTFKRTSVMGAFIPT